MDTRSAVQSRHYEARIIRKGRKAQYPGSETRLFVGIIVEGFTVFFDFGDRTKIIQIFDFHREIPQNIANFCCFALIPGGDYKYPARVHFVSSYRAMFTVISNPSIVSNRFYKS